MRARIPLLIALLSTAAVARGETDRSEASRPGALCAARGPLRWSDHASSSLVLRALDRPRPARAVIGYPFPARFPGRPEGFDGLASRAYLYDGALFVLERAGRRDRAGAEAAAEVLLELQRADGGFGASLDTGSGQHDSGYVRAGNVAFAVYALAKLSLAWDHPRAAEAARRGGRWLLERRDPATGLIRAGSGLWAPRGFVEVELDHQVTEHQIDAFFALLALDRLDPSGGWRDAAQDVAASAIAGLWIEAEGRFAAGWSAAEGLDGTSALDAAGTWGALFWIALGRPEQARRALSWIERHHPLDPRPLYRPYPGAKTAFVEASIAFALAAHRLGDPSAAARLAAIRDLGCAEGLPLPYATAWAPDFPRTPAAAPTLWFALTARELGGFAPFLWSEAL